MKFERREATEIKNSRIVRVKRMGHIVEVMGMTSKCNGLQNVKKISKTQYVNIHTGEVFECKISENRAQNVAGLKDTFGKIRDLINNNFEGAKNELHITITYAENMKDTQKLYDDFKSFWRKFKRRYGNHYEYISVVEPQGRGAWHCHVLVKDTTGKPMFIPNDDIYAIWTEGWTKTKSMDGIDNLGAYLSGYLADVELTDENLMMLHFDYGNGKGLIPGQGIVEKEVDGVKKKFIKGARCYMYPTGMNLYRHSRGIKFPETKNDEL